jgi:SAM-dependent methyltransferase
MVTIVTAPESPPEDRRRERASSFGAVAQLYDRVRPSYPEAAVRWALEPLGVGAHRIADIGAGTGIMTRLLASLGQHTIAVEPDEQMRRQLLATTTDVEAVPGRAESLPFDDASIDGAIAAQAYHWFDRDRAHPELGRVIRPGGVFAAVWNDRDESVAWVTEYTRIIQGDRDLDGGGTDSTREAHTGYGEGFGPVEVATFRHATTHTPDSLVALLRSRSYFLTASPQRKAALEHEVRDLARSHPDLSGRPEFELSYLTVVYRATHV